MRIHGTTAAEARFALADCRELLPDSVWAEITNHGSRSHGCAIEVTLRSDNPDDRRDGRRRRLPNFGTARGVDRFDGYGAEYAASYEEWGWFLAALYERRAELLCGSPSYPVYRDREDYHRATDNRFHPTSPNPYDPTDPETAEKIVRNPERFSRAKVIRAKSTIARTDIAERFAEEGLGDLASYVRKHGPVRAIGYCDAEIARAKTENELYHRGEGWELHNLEVAREELRAAARKS